MEALALKVYKSVTDGSKVTVENASIIGKAAMLAEQMGYIKAVAVSPGHTTFVAAR